MKRLLILCFLLICWKWALSQHYSFVNYSTANGLPQSQVTSIEQDHLGYLWVGTLGGLSRFNGKEFRTFSTDDGLLNNRISVVRKIGEALFIGHEGGLSVYRNGKVKTWSFPRKFRNIPVSDIVWFDHSFVVSTNGAGLFLLKDNQLTALSIYSKSKVKLHMETAVHVYAEDDLRVRDMHVFKKELWIGTRAGVINGSQVNRLRHIRELDAYNVSGISSLNGKIYLTTFNGEFIAFDYRKKSTHQVKGIDPLATIRGCFPTKNGKLLVYSNTGVSIFKAGKKLVSLNAVTGLPTENIRSAFCDRNGTIWMGSEGKGLIRYTGSTFRYWNVAIGMPSELILSIIKDRDNTLWLGTYDRGILFKKQGEGFVHIPQSKDMTIWCSMLSVDGYHWFGTGTSLIAVSNHKIERTFVYEDGLPGTKISSLFQLSKNSFLVGGDEGLSLYQGKRFIRIKSNELLIVRNICRINNAIYCACDKGLYLLKNRELILVKSLQEPCYSLTTDGKGCLWVGTERGVFRVEKNKANPIHYARDAASNTINFLHFHRGVLYLGSNNGLIKLKDPYTSQTKAVFYGMDEGLIDLETNLNAFFMDKRGNGWFGTASGLMNFHASGLQKPREKPQLLIKRILVNFEPLSKSLTSETTHHSKFTAPFELPSYKNSVTFELDPVELSKHNGLTIQYKLSGEQAKWSPFSSNSTLTFNNLPSGDYTLFARAVTKNGDFSKTLTVRFSILPPLYLTWWFIFISVLLVSSGIFGFFRFRINVERTRGEKEKLGYTSRLLILEQQALNASMNRHFIFNALNSIQYFINTQDRQSANKYLTNFAKLIRKNLDTSEEGNIISLQQEIDRLDIYLSLESMRFPNRFDYTIDIAKGIPAEQILIPAMLIQPFIENSIIHGILPNEDKKGLLLLSFSMKRNELIIKINDNGVGIETSIQRKKQSAHKSQGTDLIRKRMDILGKVSQKRMILIGPFEEKDAQGLVAGTEVILKIHVENLDN
jgi:ligand-binding sensor domain-containing protein/two-component sensor histidine kinase